MSRAQENRQKLQVAQVHIFIFGLIFSSNPVSLVSDLLKWCKFQVQDLCNGPVGMPIIDHCPRPHRRHRGHRQLTLGQRVTMNRLAKDLHNGPVETLLIHHCTDLHLKHLKHRRLPCPHCTNINQLLVHTFL